MFEQTKALCQHFLDKGIPAFDLIVYKDGECVLRHMAGYADPEKKIPIKGNEKYHMFSCSKPITCVAAMQLWEKGLFSLDDELADYLPAFREMYVKTEEGLVKAKNPIKIHHLFEMTAGLTYNIKTPELLEYYEACDHRCPTVETVNVIAKTPLAFEPGTGWRYSLCHDVLAALVEVVSGKKFEIYVKENIFMPLGMENSDFLYPLEALEKLPQLYRYDAETGEYELRWKNNYRLGSEYASGGAGCVSTVEDCIKFLEALRVGDVILKKETIEMMSKDRLTEQQREMYTYDKVANGYGLGLRTPRLDPEWTEFGWGGASGAFSSVDPVNNITIYYAQHVLSSPVRALRPWLYRTVRADLLGQKIHVPIEQEDEHPELTY
ncbi:MAG: beta-lactamase family protein [Oscillospiraceae bacterium]|nr:beta-lactamase family protein [Oscillospiraceae bacterium]MBR2977071.1 beta-lactamase family protein [Oscillospiraceae bacterium]